MKVIKIYQVTNRELKLHASANSIKSLIELVKLQTNIICQEAKGFLVGDNFHAKIITTYLGIKNDNYALAGNQRYLRELLEG